METKSKRPSSNKFKQQKLWAFRPKYTVQSTAMVFGTLCIVFVLLGSVSLGLALSITESTYRYDNISDCTSDCELTFTLSSSMTSPVYLYYELHNFYQNHRLYVKSRSYPQLKGESLGHNEVDKCEPVTRNRDLYMAVNPWGYALDPQETANPCGLAARSLFNDQFILEGPSGAVSIDNTDLTWESDLDYIYKRNRDYITSQWTDVEDERFAVWMKLAVHPTFRKLWGIIHQDLEPGDYSFRIQNNFDVSEWGGEKHLVLTEANSLGGRNIILGVSLITGGILCAMAAIGACILKKIITIDPNEIKWK